MTGPEEERSIEIHKDGNYIVLCVDDDPHIPQIVKIMLGRASDATYTVVTAASTTEAKDILKNQQEKNEPVDLVIIDDSMPIENGIDFCKRWREEEADTKTPFILFSTRYLMDVQEQFNAAGMNGYLQKPLTPKTLQQAVAKILNIPSQQ